MWAFQLLAIRPLKELDVAERDKIRVHPYFHWKAGVETQRLDSLMSGELRDSRILSNYLHPEPTDRFVRFQRADS